MPHRKSGQARGADYSYRFSPLREPTPSEPSAADAVDDADVSVDPAAGTAAASASSFTASKNVAEGTKNRVPVTARLKSSTRSSLSGGRPKNMFSIICSVTRGVRQ